MQRRSLALIQLAGYDRSAAASADPSHEPSVDGERMREGLLCVAELEERAGLFAEAVESYERWRNAGGDGVVAAERIEQLRAGGLAVPKGGGGGGGKP